MIVLLGQGLDSGHQEDDRSHIFGHLHSLSQIMHQLTIAEQPADKNRYSRAV